MFLSHDGLFRLKRFGLSVYYLLNLQFIFSPALSSNCLPYGIFSVVVGYYIVFGFWHIVQKSNAALLVLVGLSCLGAAYVLHKMTGLLDGRFSNIILFF